MDSTTAWVIIVIAILIYWGFTAWLNYKKG
jgi:hypothetical protein